MFIVKSVNSLPTDAEYSASISLEGAIANAEYSASVVHEDCVVIDTTTNTVVYNTAHNYNPNPTSYIYTITPVNSIQATGLACCLNPHSVWHPDWQSCKPVSHAFTLRTQPPSSIVTEYVCPDHYTDYVTIHSINT